VGDERWTCFGARAARSARATLHFEDASTAIHDSRFTTAPVPHITTPGTRTQTSRACIAAGPAMTDCYRTCNYTRGMTKDTAPTVFVSCNATLHTPIPVRGTKRHSSTSVNRA
jgi:hypothetical protein